VLKRRQADLAATICAACGFGADEAGAVAALVRKDGLSGWNGDGVIQDAQVLEDVACLVFLDDQLDAFEKGVEELKMLAILRKTWLKMSPRGRELAAGIDMSERAKELVQRALADGGGEDGG
jgi:hypothetical protein